MAANKFGKFWTLIAIFLVVTIIVGGILVWSRYSRSQAVEIFVSSPSSQEKLNLIYIGGAVVNPSLYPLKAGDNIEALIQAAGGMSSSADPGWLKLYVPVVGEEKQSQKVNINRAEAWLLEALPGIGRIRAQAIIDYRRQKGLFRNINELAKVEGIGITTYEKIRDLITVVD